MSRLADALERARHLAAPTTASPPGFKEALPGAEPTPARGTGGLFHPPHPAASARLVTDPRMPQRAVEEYRQLAASLHQMQLERNVRVAMVTSALAGEGKTLTAVNAALTLSISYRRHVLLVDADLRRPSVHHLLRLAVASGLSDGLKAETDVPLPLTRIAPLLAVLPAGRPDPDPMSALVSDRMRRVISEAADAFEWVIIDTPPVGILPDAHLLSAMVDAAVLVVRAGVSPYPLVQRAIDAIGRERIAGVVLNGAEVGSRGAGYYYDYYSSATDGGDLVAQGED